MVKMKNSGYSKKYRMEILNSAMKAFDKISRKYYAKIAFSHIEHLLVNFKSVDHENMITVKQMFPMGLI